ncbi:hypothetical protein [Acinetobacter soli]|uniref:hypothetical protein n=1 Tax=Acinetobacter soli TaxID=487316 RepID=UPI00046AD09D|nr:hypothetical protein [Acinetobacter soli]
MCFNKDNVINAFCIFAIVATICVILVLVLKLFFGQEIDVGFVKDIFSIGSTLAAALIAVALFSDWKEQHNKTIEKDLILDLINEFLKIKHKNLKIFVEFNDILEEDEHNEVFSSNKHSSLNATMNNIKDIDIEINLFQIKYKILCSFNEKYNDDDLLSTIKKIKTNILKMDNAKNTEEKIKIIKHYLLHFINDFHNHFEKITNNFTDNMKADK